MYKLQSTHPKQKQKQIMHESSTSNYKKKPLEVLKNKNNFITVIGDKFAMSIKWE